MHGLRCAPGLLGWTRLLDEWVVGLSHLETTAPCWEDPQATVLTLADAVTRVRTFAGRSDDPTRTVPDGQGTLRFELQGVAYRVSTGQCFPATPQQFQEQAGQWLSTGAEQDDGPDVAVQATFITPRLVAEDQDRRFEVAADFVEVSRGLALAACAFSFPDASEIVRYHYANEIYPGVVLLVAAEGF